MKKTCLMQGKVYKRVYWNKFTQNFTLVWSKKDGSLIIKKSRWMFLLRFIKICLYKTCPDRKRTVYTVEWLFLAPVLYVTHLLLLSSLCSKTFLIKLLITDCIYETTLQRMRAYVLRNSISIIRNSISIIHILWFIIISNKFYTIDVVIIQICLILEYATSYFLCYLCF